MKWRCAATKVCVCMKIDKCQWNRQVVGTELVHQPMGRGNKATRAGVCAGGCGSMEVQMDRIYVDVVQCGCWLLRRVFPSRFL